MTLGSSVSRFRLHFKSKDKISSRKKKQAEYLGCCLDAMNVQIKKKFILSIQYLEDAPGLPERETSAVVDKLRAAADRLPISHLLIGWHLPPRLLYACRKEAERLGMRFLRWHPLLTGDDVFLPESSHQVIGVSGHKVPGYRDKSEFTFVCPNHPEVREAASGRIEALLKEGLYQGFFLDRVRFPSPTRNPLDDLGCFCEHCRLRAATIELDLEQVRNTIIDLDQTSKGRFSLMQILLGGMAQGLPNEATALLLAFLKFRSQSMNDFVNMISKSLKQAGLEIGLDCFSPCLTGMVGQDLHSLGPCADWIKVMSYAHTRGPAGIPFELTGIFDYLSTNTDLEPSRILRWISDTIDIPLPSTRQALEYNGISSEALELELRRSVQASLSPILAGFELMEIESIAELNDTQILSDLDAVRRAGVRGLSISWDLWDIPLERLSLVSRKFPMFSPKTGN